MFNNYQVNLERHSGLTKFLSTLNEQQQNELLSVISDIQHLLNNNMEEKEKLLNVVNNMQIQTQNSLDSELLKNAELTKQIAQQKHIISKQIEEIAQLNQFVIQRKKERRSLYSSPLQTSNKQMIQQSILPVTSLDYYQKLMEEQCKREDSMLKLWKKLQQQSFEKVKSLQEAVEYYLMAQNTKYEQNLALQTDIINKLEDQLNKYKVALKLIQIFVDHFPLFIMKTCGRVIHTKKAIKKSQNQLLCSCNESKLQKTNF